MRGGLALDGGVHGEDHFARAARGDAAHERVERRERAAQHVITAAIGAGALDGPEIGDILDDADEPGIAPRVATDAARIGGVEIATGRAGANALRRVGQRRCQGLHHRLVALQKIERGAPGGTRAQAGQLGKEMNQTIEVAQNGSFIPGGSLRPPVSLLISSATWLSTRCLASLKAARTRSSSTSTSLGSASDLSILILRTSPLPVSVTCTRPPPAAPVIST